MLKPRKFISLLLSLSMIVLSLSVLDFKVMDINAEEKGIFPCFSLTDDELLQIASLCQQEQGSAKGAAAEASLMANLYEIKGSSYGSIYNYARNGKWFANAPTHMDKRNATSDVLSAVRNVLINGKRTVPAYIDEHDCFSDISSATNNGVSITKTNRSQYERHVTIIKNRYGSTYTFYCFPTSSSDPFGYTSQSRRASKGEAYYDYDTGILINGSDPIPSGDKYFVVTESSNLNIRSSYPSGTIIGKAPKGAEVTVLEIVADGTWAKIYYDGLIGYSSMAYLSKNNNPITEMVCPTLSFDKSSYVVEDRVNMSWVASPSTSNIDHYWLTIYGPDGTILNEDMKLNTSYSFTPSKAGEYTITSFATPKNSPDGSGSLTNTVTITVTERVWYANLTPVDVGTDFYAYIINVEPWLHLVNNENNIVTASPLREQSQFWKFKRNSDGSYRIINCLNGNLLDVYGCYSDSGTNVQVYPDHDDTSAQKWYIYGESGNYTIRPACSDCVLDVAGASTEPGANVQIYTKNGSFAQSFQIWKEQAELSVVPGDKSNKTRFDWSDFTGNGIHYNLRIWKDSLWKGDSYYDKWNLADTECEIALPIGHYEAYVDECIGTEVQMSNVVKFDIKEDYSIQSTLSVIPGEKYSKSLFNWTQIDGVDDYTLKIWNNSAESGDLFCEYTSSEDSFEIPMVAGKYEAYIETYVDKVSFKSESVIFAVKRSCKLLDGDANEDGVVSIADAVMLQKWLLAINDSTLSCWQNADLDNNDIVNVFDLCILKRMLIER